jgi:aminopeptidase N
VLNGRELDPQTLRGNRLPLHAVAAATLRAGEDCLADAELPASLRRLLADQLDDLRRALQVRSGAA